MPPKRFRTDDVKTPTADEMESNKEGLPESSAKRLKKMPVARTSAVVTLKPTPASATVTNPAPQVSSAPMPQQSPVSTALPATLVNGLFVRSPTVAWMPISGLPVQNTNRYEKITFQCQQCFHKVEDALCIGAPMRAKRVLDKSVSGERRYFHVWIVRGQFCTISCMLRYVKDNRREMHPRRVTPLVKLMTLLAYGCHSDIPLALSRWDMPRFQCPLVGHHSEEDVAQLERARTTWNIHAYRRELHMPLNAPDPSLHYFYDEPSYLIVDAMQSQPRDMLVWYDALQERYPQLLYARNYSTQDLDRLPKPLVTGRLESATKALVAMSAPDHKDTPTTQQTTTSTSTIPTTTMTANTTTNVTTEMRRGRGRPRKPPPTLIRPSDAHVVSEPNVVMPRQVPLTMETVTSVLSVDAFVQQQTATPSNVVGLAAP